MSRRPPRSPASPEGQVPSRSRENPPANRVAHLVHTGDNHMQRRAPLAVIGLALFSATQGFGCLGLVCANFGSPSYSGGAGGSGAGTGAFGGAGGVTHETCEPLTSQDCYDGPEETYLVGDCKPGLQTCGQDEAWGPCLGQVLPASQCGPVGSDADCDGRSGAFEWGQRFQGADIQRILDLVVAPDGSTFVTGYLWNSTFVEEELIENGTFVVKLDPDGHLVWAKGFGPFKGAVGVSIALDPAGDVIFSGFIGAPVDLGGGLLTPLQPKNAAYIAKLSGASGAHMWSELVADGTGTVTNAAVAVNAAGQVLVGGVYTGDLAWPGCPVLTNPDSGAHMFLSLLDADGKCQSVHDFGGKAVPQKVRFGLDGGLVVSGVVLGLADLGGGWLNTGEVSSFVAAFTPDYQHVWSQALSVGTNQFFGRDVTILADGTIVTAFTFENTLLIDELQIPTKGLYDIGVAAFSPEGLLLWVRAFGGPGYDAPWTVTATTDGDIVVGGTFQGTFDLGGCQVSSQLEYDALLIKLDVQGNVLWAHTFGDPDFDEGDFGAGEWPSEIVMASGAAPGGGVIIAAEFDGTVSYGGEPITADAPGSAIVVRYSR